jgi:predicted TIM-barrel fold metal-dependent hydrolase
MPTDIVDLWVNVVSAKTQKDFVSQRGFEGIPALLGADTGGISEDEMVALMDENDVATGVLVAGLHQMDIALKRAHDFPGRFQVAAGIEDATRPRQNVKKLYELASEEALTMVRVMPLVQQYELNHRLYYPVYAACEELGISVGINVGIPGPRVRSACQRAELLEDVLIDFPDLVVIASHGGHPFEDRMIAYMLRFPNLYLSNSAFLATYLDPKIVNFMDTSRGRGRHIWA